MQLGNARGTRKGVYDRIDRSVVPSWCFQKKHTKDVPASEIICFPFLRFPFQDVPTNFVGHFVPRVHAAVYLLSTSTTHTDPSPSTPPHFPSSMPRFAASALAATAGVLYFASLASAVEGAPALPACPTIPLDNVAVLAGPCTDPMMACDLELGCIGAVVSYVGERIDLSQFTEPPPPEYVADCVAPFALSEEVTAVIPQETLGAMIGCDFDAVTARFETAFNLVDTSAEAPAPAPMDGK